jgi:hypothetical protein
VASVLLLDSVAVRVVTGSCAGVGGIAMSFAVLEGGGRVVADQRTQQFWVAVTRSNQDTFGCGPTLANNLAGRIFMLSR